MPRCLVALGSNLGDRAQQIAQARAMIGALPGVSALHMSRLHETRPVGGPAGQQRFLNSAIVFETSLSAEQLHAALRAVETALGRQPGERWAARTIDLDLLLYGDAIVDTPDLVVPHPRMAFRRFVLEPAAEVAADMVLPDSGRSVSRLLGHLNTAAAYVALLGLPGSGKTELARRLASVTGGQFIADRTPDVGRAGPQGTSTVPAGPEYQRQIQFLASRAELLDRGRWRDPGKLAISDFYLDQCLAYAESGLNAREMAAYREAHRAAAAQVILPKLLVVLDTRPIFATAGRQSASLGDRLLALAARPETPPVLYAGRDDAERQFAEASAAVEAMQ